MLEHEPGEGDGTKASTEDLLIQKIQHRIGVY